MPKWMRGEGRSHAGPEDKAGLDTHSAINKADHQTSLGAECVQRRLKGYLQVFEECELWGVCCSVCGLVQVSVCDLVFKQG